MDYLQIALVVLAVAGVWAIVEVALTLRTTRKSITEITLSANNTIEQIQPVISKIDGMVDELDPTIKQLPALMQKVDEAAENANTSLESLNVVLGDVATGSGAASAVTATVSKAASDAVTGVVESVSKLGTGLGGSLNPSKLAEVAQARLSGATASAQQSAQRAQEYLEELPLLSQDKTKHSKPARTEQFYIEYGSESSQKTEE